MQIVELQGHRGARGILPENSLAGFRHAIMAGVDSLEIDIAMTHDKQLVATHDPALNPDITRHGTDWITNQRPIRSLTAAQLRSYDIGRLRPGSKYADRFPQQAPIDGLRMPLLSDVLDMPELLKKDRLHLDIEIKTSPIDEAATFPPAVIAATLIELINETGFGQRTRIRSFDWRSLMHARQTAPQLPLAFLTAKQSWLNTIEGKASEKSPWLNGLDINEFGGSVPRAVHHAGGQIWAPHYCDLSPSELELAHELGLRVIVWTINDGAEMVRMINMGVDGITTDYPELGRSVIDAATAET